MLMMNVILEVEVYKNQMKRLQKSFELVTALLDDYDSKKMTSDLKGIRRLE